MNAMSPDDFIRSYETALATQRWEAVAPLVHDGACVTFSTGTVHVGKEAVREAYMRNFAAIRDERFSIKKVHWVRLDADVAVYLFEYRWSGLIDGNPASGAGRGTTVIVREEERWLLLAEHLGLGIRELGSDHSPDS